MIKRTFNYSYAEYNHVEELASIEQELIHKANQAADKAYAPYSEFKVGASVLLQNGKIFTGSNQENAAYPSGLCAERVALFYANAQFPDIPVSIMVIYAKNKKGQLPAPIPPCGACRQVILETEMRYNSDIKIILAGTNSIVAIENSKQLLPLHFDKDSLTIETPLSD